MTSHAEHAPRNAMTDADEIARFHDRCSDLMRELLDGLARAPDEPRAFPATEAVRPAGGRGTRPDVGSESSGEFAPTLGRI